MKAELKTEQNRNLKLQASNSSNFCDKKFFGGDGFQSMFVYHPTFNMLELKKQEH